MVAKLIDEGALQYNKKWQTTADPFKKHPKTVTKQLYNPPQKKKKPTT